MTPNDVREQLKKVIDDAEGTDTTNAAVAMERLNNALEMVLIEAENPSAGDTVMFSQARLCRQLATALGLRGGAS